MDFSSRNPTTSNALNLAARKNDVANVSRLLKKINPNCVDNRGWTCLHEAACADSYDSLLLIMKHPLFRPNVETHEGHTALYLACRGHGTSLQTIKLLLESNCGDINQCGTEGLSPLHVATNNGNLKLMELLLENGAVIDAQDYDGDTPLHAACFLTESPAVEVLLRAGANPLQTNKQLFTPFHLACLSNSLQGVRQLMPYMKDCKINLQTVNGLTPLMLTLHSYETLSDSDRLSTETQYSNNYSIFNFLLENGADPNLKNGKNKLALDIAIATRYHAAFVKLLEVTDEDIIDVHIVSSVMQPHNFCLDIVEALLGSKLGPKFFDFKSPVPRSVDSIMEVDLEYVDHAALNAYMEFAEYVFNKSPTQFREIYELFLKRGVSVNAQKNEYPPLAYIHHCSHDMCFESLMKMMLEQGLNVDYCSTEFQCIPDAFIASMIAGAATAPIMMPYSLYCDPDLFIKVAANNELLDIIPVHDQKKLMSLIDVHYSDLTAIEYSSLHFVPPLKYLCRLQIRNMIKLTGNGKQKNTQEYLEILDSIPIPRIIKEYLRFLQ